MQDEKLDKLVDRLLLETENGEIRWKEGVRRNAYQFSFPDYSVIFEGNAPAKGGAFPTNSSFRVLDPHGEIAVSAVGGQATPISSEELGHAVIDGAKLARLLGAARKSVTTAKTKAVEDLPARLA